MDEIMGSGAPIRLEDYIADLRAKLAAAEAKVAQCREVLKYSEVGTIAQRIRDGEAWDVAGCPFCRAEMQRSGDVPHKPDCAWKRAMEDDA